MTIKESIVKAIADLTDDKSQAARYMFVIGLCVIFTPSAQLYAKEILFSIVGGFLVMMGRKSQ